MGYAGECRRKRRYSTKRAALDKATERGIHLRPYRCPWCHGWHLTADVAGNSAPVVGIQPARKVNWQKSRTRWLRKQAK